MALVPNAAMPPATSMAAAILEMDMDSLRLYSRSSGNLAGTLQISARTKEERAHPRDRVTSS